jgi:hypothetical protein
MELGAAPGLLDVWGTGAQDVFAVGHAGTIRHYDGQAWAGVYDGAGGTLQSVHGTSGSDVFVVGENGLVLHYDGAEWGELPFPDGADLSLCAVWCAGPAEVFVIGVERIGYDEYRHVYYWDGDGWQKIRSEEGGICTMWGTSKDSLFVGGGYISHWNGSEWKELITATGDASEEIVGVVVNDRNLNSANR